MPDFSQINLQLIIPVLIIVLLILISAKALQLPAEYFKNRQIREAMLKRRAERKDLEAMEKRKMDELANMFGDDSDESSDPLNVDNY